MEKVRSGAALRPRALQIGLGRFGTHLNKFLKEQSFFDLSTIENLNQFNNEDFDLKSFSYVFLTTPDAAISEYLKIIPRGVRVVHFSGFFYDPKALGVHPVSSFSKKGDFDLRKIEYVVDGHLDENLKKIFVNTSLINGAKKKDYHTYLSLSANSLQLIVNRLGEDFAKETGLSKNLLKNIVLQSLMREKEFGEDSFSGPWTRREEDNQFKHVDSMDDAYLKDLSDVFKKSIRKYREKR